MSDDNTLLGGQPDPQNKPDNPGNPDPGGDPQNKPDNPGGDPQNKPDNPGNPDPGGPHDPNKPAPGGQPDFPEFLSSIEGLDEDLKKDPSLKPIKDIPNLVKAYVHSQKMIGKDKAILPGKDSPKEEWDSFYQKLGKPDSPDKFELKKSDDDGFSEDFMEEFKKAAYETNILPDQAQKMYEFFKEQEKKEDDRFVEENKKQLEQEINSLKQEWGQKLDDNLKVAQKGAVEFGGQEFLDYLKESGLGNNPKVVKLLYKVGETVSTEDEGDGSPAKKFGYTPDEARTEYYKILDDSNDAYNRPNHPDHKRRVDEVSRLFEAMGPKR